MEKFPNSGSPTNYISQIVMDTIAEPMVYLLNISLKYSNCPNADIKIREIM